MPKFIGPYKILKDYGNASFLLDLPAHLKRRGVHNVFHSSLLRIHVPNDDRLFPGRMDTQVGMDTQTDGEWTVDKILSHSGSRTDSVFEVKWRSGDVTWLPYYQITHLQALTDYLELLGANSISKLPRGTSTPPGDDPQIFIGSLHFSAQPTPFLSLPIFSLFFSYLNTIVHFILAILRSFFPSTSTFVSPTLDLDYRLDMPPRSCINHPHFTRLSPTQYLMRHPGSYLSTIIHVGQIATILQFDDEIRTRGDIHGVWIAKAKSCCIIPRGARPPYFFLEWFDGKNSFMDTELLQQKMWINEIVEEFIKLEKLSYNAIGCLTFKSEDKPDLYVGPMVEPMLCGCDKQGQLSQLGPFKNAQDFCVAQVQQVLAQIEGGFKYSQNAVDAYLIHLEVIDLIKNPLSNMSRSTSILHQTCR